MFDNNSSLDADIIVLATEYKNMMMHRQKVSLIHFLTPYVDYCGDGSREGSRADRRRCGHASSVQVDFFILLDIVWGLDDKAEIKTCGDQVDIVSFYAFP